MAQDFSVTGIGLGQFNAVFQRLYLPVQFGPAVYVPHVHNLFLEYALELGVPGFVACAALVVGVVRLGLSGARAPDRQVQCTAIGLLLGLLAFAVFGLTDALAPGARAGLVLWIVLGLCAATGHATLVASEPTG
jgi:putative inorganic carbon (HCO3(-)) transporter